MADGVDPQLITMEEAAVILNKSTRTVARLIAGKKLKSRRVLNRTMLARADVDAYKAENP